MKIKCDKCGEELKALGGLLFGPPILNTCNKYHLCVKCYREIRDLILFGETK